MAQPILLGKIQTPQQANTVEGVATGVITVASSVSGYDNPTAVNVEGTWSEVDLGPGNRDTQRRILTPAEGMYPNATGVSFWIDGVFSRTDPTGPNEGSLYYPYPWFTLEVGTTIHATWTDVNGFERESFYVAQNPAAIAPTASGVIGVTGTAVGPSSATGTASGVIGVSGTAIGPVSSSKPLPNVNTGTTGPLTKTFPGTNITQAWLNTNNGGSLVLENVEFTGGVKVRVDNLVLRNFKINANGASYGLYNEQFTSFISYGLIAEDGEIINASSSLVLGSFMTLRRLYLHESDADAIKPWSNSTVEGCYATRLGRAVGSHADAVQMVTGSNCVYRGNNFDMPKNAPAPYKSNAAFIIQTNNGPINNIMIEDNWLNGGNFTIYVLDKGNGHGMPTNVTVRNNRFGRDYGFGIKSGGGNWYGNVWDDTGEAID